MAELQTSRARWAPRLVALAAATACGAANAQPVAPGAQPTDSWRSCSATQDAAARLACFDSWARRQQAEPAVVAPPGVSPPPAPTGPPPTIAPAQAAVVAGDGCHDGRNSRLTRFWELDKASDCGRFELRGYRPISLSVVSADSVNRQPQSPAPGRSAETEEDYRTVETRIQLSARVKVASNLLTAREPSRSDSIWVGFTQQSYWQFFSPELSRPFRTTDYEPEVAYVYPPALDLFGGLKLRYVGLALSHQSNGRQLPQSRSWNRVIASAGVELDDRFSVEARLWKRFGEHGNDDNPDISDSIGRTELTATWQPNPVNTFALSGRYSLSSTNRGSARLEWFRALGRGNRPGNLNDLRLHAQFFSGYGDSLVDYNRKRNVFSLGLALVDW